MRCATASVRTWSMWGSAWRRLRSWQVMTAWRRRDGTGRTGGVFDVLEVQEVVPQFSLRDALRGLVVMICQLADGPDIHLLSPLRQAAELKVLDHSLTQWGHGDISCPQRVESIRWT